MESYIVVGGGIAGLTAANALADAGHGVKLLEQSERLGGRASTLEERGYRLNFGPHALYRAGQAMRIFREWDIPMPGSSPVYGNHAWLFYGPDRYRFFADYSGISGTSMFDECAKREAEQLMRLFVSGPLAIGETMEHWLTRHTRSERVRHFGAAMVRLRTYSADLQWLDAAAGQEQFRTGASQGVLYVDGGWQTLIEGLAQRARARGVEIRCGEPVDRLDAFDDAGVVLAVPPAAVERIAGARLPDLPPVRMSCLDLGLRKLPEGATGFGLGVDRPLYLSVHSLAAKLAPEGAAVAHIAKYLDSTQPGGCDRAELEEFADLAIPGWRGEAEVTRFLPNMTVVHSAVIPHGRPDVDVLGRQGVVVAGDWIGPEGMLANAAAASGLRAARALQTCNPLARSTS